MARTTYSLLALDGGGIRGVIPARVLDAIEQRTGRPICELFDLVGGTSTGGILALGLTKPSARDSAKPAFSASNLLDFYLDEGETIFPGKTLWERVTNPLGMADVRYSAKPLEGLLQQRFGDTMLSEALTEICIPSYDLSKPAAYFFKREYARDEEHSWDTPMALVARATSAAPTYFNPAKIEDHALVDGGVFANNPAAAAYADALDLWGHDVEIQVISIGTGQPPQELGRGPIPVAYANANGWGLAHWARPVLEVVFDGVAEAVEYQLKRLCRQHEGGSPRYHRLQSDLPTAAHAMDDASAQNLGRLMDDATTLIRSEQDTLEEICTMLQDVAEERDAALVES
jgi:predicted acylesterase/phospholipase RssA